MVCSRPERLQRESQGGAQPKLGLLYSERRKELDKTTNEQPSVYVAGKQLRNIAVTDSSEAEKKLEYK